MFTGIIEEKGKVKSIASQGSCARITISADKIFSDLKTGDSVAVNGVCLTACDITSDTFSADVMAETMRRSNLGKLKTGDSVNLERAMLSGGRFGGHIVSGHIDSTGVIKKLKTEGNAVWVTISADETVMRYIIEKGSVAIDGISLTVADVSVSSFSVSVIPHTGSETTLLDKKQGDEVNLECDIIGKYVEKLMPGKDENKTKSSLNRSFLMEHGFI
ncbi:MAG: riboflavin synthase [Oscillospiraceae bacterium]|nr:riboflavin synthase [Oscillospiraceae bacterium]